MLFKAIGEAAARYCAASSRPCSRQCGKLRSELRSGSEKTSEIGGSAPHPPHSRRAASLEPGQNENRSTVSAASQALRKCNQLAKQLCSQHRTQLKKQPDVACCHGRFDQKTKKYALQTSDAEVPNQNTAGRSTLQPASSKKKSWGG